MHEILTNQFPRLGLGRTSKLLGILPQKPDLPLRLLLDLPKPAECLEHDPELLVVLEVPIWHLKLETSSCVNSGICCGTGGESVGWGRGIMPFTYIGNWQSI